MANEGVEALISLRGGGVRNLSMFILFPLLSLSLPFPFFLSFYHLAAC